MPIIKTFHAVVRDLSGRGTGVVDHPEGRVVFVPGVWPGDVGEFEITQVEKRYALGRLVQLTERSPHRITPQCSHHGVDEGSCGGCPWMMGEYSSQVSFKEKFLLELFKRAGLGNGMLSPLIPAPESYGYRNRAEFKTEGEKLGYVSPGTHRIIDIKECPILTPKNQITLSELRAQLPNPLWRPKPKEKWTALSINEQICAADVRPNESLGFLQGNSSQNARMREWLCEHMEKHSKDTEVLELFCGSGNFTECLSALGFEDILAVEGSRDAIETLKLRELRGVRALEVNLYGAKALKQVQRAAVSPGVLLLDPPRSGFEGLAGWVSAFKNLKSIYYVSCDPITFVRDAKSLFPLGIVLVEVTPIDLFPHTPHIELMAKFQVR